MAATTLCARETQTSPAPRALLHIENAELTALGTTFESIGTPALPP